MDRALRLFGYLKYNPKARLALDPSAPNLETALFKNEEDWKGLYSDSEEAIDNDMPEPANVPKLPITVIVDASHASDLVTRRGVTGFIIVVRKAIICWYSKQQNTVETLTYSAELVAMRLAMEALLDIRYTLRMMGLKFERTSNILGDNQAMIMNTTLPSSTLKKKHCSVAYHKCQEMVACGIVHTAHINGNGNIADILTKPKGPIDYRKYLRRPLYGKYDIAAEGESQKCEEFLNESAT